MIDPIFASPLIIAFTIVGWLLVIKIFILGPAIFIKHVHNAFNKNVDSKTKSESREILYQVKRGISGYLTFLLSLIIGISFVLIIGNLNTGFVFYKIIALLLISLIFVALLMVYMWAQNRI